MAIQIKYRRSAGTWVIPPVRSLVRRANRARNAGRWSDAASDYRAALHLDATLTPVWIQYGHALKELRDFDGAEQAYNEAASRRPDLFEVHFQLGHFYKMRRNTAAASRSFMRSLELKPDNPEALLELCALASDGNSKITPRTLIKLLENRDPGGVKMNLSGPVDTALDAAQTALEGLIEALKDEASSQSQPRLEVVAAAATALSRLAEEPAVPEAASSVSVVFDVSDLIAYFQSVRLPTGIQRVQIETIAAALQIFGSENIDICTYNDKREEWLKIPHANFLTLCRLSLLDGDTADQDWLLELTRLHFILNTSYNFPFPIGSYLINLGSSWHLANYFLSIRQARNQRGVRYVPFVHDVIPIFCGEYCPRELREDFIHWLISMFEHADFFLVNSLATKRDLLEVARTLGHDVKPETIEVVRLDADFRRPGTQTPAKSALNKWGLAQTPFILFVSTIEPRKNHLGALDAWASLIRRHGARHVPKLVCVGNRGWLNDAIFARLHSHAGLRERVLMLSGLSDAELGLLYQSCMFTLYPSHYEGWGLPVTESLCYGKVPLVSDSSSIPEAGGDFAVYFETGSTTKLTEALERLIYDAGLKKSREDHIAAEFRPRTWSDIATQIIQAVEHRRETHDLAQPCAPPVKLGAYHPMARNTQIEIWPGLRSAEVFRSAGWWGIDDWGCWSKPTGGQLFIGLPQATGPLRLYLRLLGLPTQDSIYQIRADGAAIIKEGQLGAGRFIWIALDIETPPRSAIRVTIEGRETEDLAGVTGGNDRRVVAIGLHGFFLCEANDAAARANFMEAIIMENLDDLHFAARPLRREQSLTSDFAGHVLAVGE